VLIEVEKHVAKVEDQSWKFSYTHKEHLRIEILLNSICHIIPGLKLLHQEFHSYPQPNTDEKKDSFALDYAENRQKSQNAWD